jgi:hypothetical protein
MENFAIDRSWEDIREDEFGGLHIVKDREEVHVFVQFVILMIY